MSQPLKGRQRGTRERSSVPKNDGWKPAVPLSEIHPNEIARAEQLQRALQRALSLPDAATLTARAELAADDFAREFGRRVGDRHLRNLIGRTLDRDGGVRQFQRLELYLSDTPMRKAADQAPRRRVRGFDFSDLETAFAGCNDRSQPNAADIAYCWRAVVNYWQDQIDGGRDTREHKAALIEFLANTLPRLGATGEAIERNLRRKLERAEEGAAALLDQRAANSGNRRKAPQWEHNIGLLAHHCGTANGLRISEAYRQLHEGTTYNGDQFTAAFRAFYPFDGRRAKSAVPNAVRAAARPWTKAAGPYLHGRKAVRLSNPSRHRDWNSIAAGAAYTSDDVTQNHYFYDWCEDGEYEFDGRRFNVLRGQFLPVVDERTDYPLGFSLIPRKTYNSRDILTLFARILMDEAIGLPYERIIFERNIWEALNIKQALTGWQLIDSGFTRENLSIGVRKESGQSELKLHHATSPKAKIIERAIGQFQNFAQYLPGYAGRNERTDTFERTAQFIGRLKRVGQPLKDEINPAEMLLSKDELSAEIERTLWRFAREPQNGERLPGISPEEGWKQLSRGPHKKLPDTLAYLLGTEVSDQTVSAEGVFVKINGLRHYYVGSERLGELIGEKVRVRFNPELPEQVHVCHLRSDPKEAAPFAVPLFQRLPAYGATREQFSAANAAVKAFRKFGETCFRIMRPRFNATLTDERQIPPEMMTTGAAHARLTAEGKSRRADRDSGRREREAAAHMEEAAQMRERIERMEAEKRFGILPEQTHEH